MMRPQPSDEAVQAAADDRELARAEQQIRDRAYGQHARRHWRQRRGSGPVITPASTVEQDEHGHPPAH